jgi:hypothetical protein
MALSSPPTCCTSTFPSASTTGESPSLPSILSYRAFVADRSSSGCLLSMPSIDRMSFTIPRCRPRSRPNRPVARPSGTLLPTDPRERRVENCITNLRASYYSALAFFTVLVGPLPSPPYMSYM